MRFDVFEKSLAAFGPAPSDGRIIGKYLKIKYVYIYTI